jgi:polyphosphate kinase
VAHIDQEIANAAAGKPAKIWLKMNSLVDPKLIDKLYEASQAGVKIIALVRGICCLRPGVAGLSDHIQVRSLVGRFLEHSRIFCFSNGSKLPSRDAKVFISSADWMPRNLNGRVETLIPILNETVHAQILDQVMTASVRDTTNTWLLNADGTYARVETTKSKTFSAHAYFMNNPSLSGRGSALKKKGAKALGKLA